MVVCIHANKLQYVISSASIFSSLMGADHESVSPARLQLKHTRRNIETLFHLIQVDLSSTFLSAQTRRYRKAALIQGTRQRARLVEVC